MKILVADRFPDRARARISENGHDCGYQPDLMPDELPSAVAGCDVLVVRSTRVTAATFQAADRLRLVIRAGSGVNTIDCDAAATRGIAVSNVPGRNALAVAELAFGLLLSLDRHIPDNVADIRGGRWNKQRYAKARGIFGRRIGIVGLGQVGLAFAERAAAFGADVYAVTKAGRAPATMERARAVGTTFVDSLESLARTCDVLSFHVPVSDATRHLIGRDLLEHVQPGAILLNTARADLVDEDALIEAMDAKGIRAGIDVMAGEPGQSSGTIDSALARHPNVYATHHIGASTEQAQHAVADEVVRMIEAMEDGEVLHRVDAAGGKSPAFASSPRSAPRR